MSRVALAVYGIVLSLIVSPSAGIPANVVEYLPRNTFGFILVRNLGEADRKVQRMLTDLRLPAIKPLELLRQTVGIADGLDMQGDLLVALVSGGDGPFHFEYCVWLPTNNYEGLLKSLGSTPKSAVTEVNVAGEDLLFAKQGDWALVMDPDQRESMEQQLLWSVRPRAPRDSWPEWGDKNDVTIVALRGGLHLLLNMSTTAYMQQQQAERAAAQRVAEGGIVPDNEADNREDFFGPVEQGDASNAAEQPANHAPNEHLAALLQLLGKLQRQSSDLRGLVRVRAIGCGLQLDDDGNALVELRASSGPMNLWNEVANDQGASGPLPALYRDGPFTILGAGQWPTKLMAASVKMYVRLLIDEMRTDEGMQLDERVVERLTQAVEQAAADVLAASVLILPGEQQDGVYTNSFAVVRVASAAKFVDAASEVARLWNQMTRDAEGGPRLVFDVAETPIGSRTAVRYSLDVAAADGAPELPEIRQAMEKLFGPGGKLTLFVVKVDEQNVLLAAATPEQLAVVLQRIDQKQPPDWNAPGLAAANRLLPAEAKWHAFFSPHDYTTWLARQTDAVVGVPVVGGPLVREFPAAPPIGAAGSLDGSDLWVKFSVPNETLRGAGTYLHGSKNPTQ